MSVRHIALVLDHLEAPPPVKLVALILADHCDSGGYCWPSYRGLAERSCLSERTVRRHVRELIESGIVTKVRTGHVTRRDGRLAYVTNAYRMSAEALASLPCLLPSAEVVTDGQVATDDHHMVVRDGRSRWSLVTTKPSVEPSREKNSLSETAGSDPATPTPRLSAKRENDWQARADEILAKTAFAANYRELGGLLAEANKSGKVALSRVVRELYEPLLDVEHEAGCDAMRAGLRAAIAKAAPNANYVRKAAASHAERPGAVAVTSRTIDRSDYDDFCTGGEL